jgi:polysaccharide export outer membrane protein
MMSHGFQRLLVSSSSILVFFALCLVSAGLAVAQQEKAAPKRDDSAKAATTSERASSNTSSSSSVLVAPEEDYRMGSNDVIEITVDDAPELFYSGRITAAGTFLMPYLGRLAAKGKTTEELAKVIADGLRVRYIYDPRVTVLVKQYNSRTFFIHGSVRSPGVYQIEGRPSLLELLTVAGGVMPEHSSSAFIIRKLKTPDAGGQNIPAKSEEKEKTGADEQPSDMPPLPQYTMLKVNVSGLLNGRFEQNTFLEPGDIVNIPPTEVFFVAGEVKAPGSFPLKEGTTLRQAISLAQGTTFKAAIGRGVVFRENPDSGKRQEIAVDIGEVMSGKKEDLQIMANDIIMVPNSRMKSIAAPVLSAFGMSVARIPMVY